MNNNSKPTVHANESRSGTMLLLLERCRNERRRPYGSFPSYTRTALKRTSETCTGNTMFNYYYYYYYSAKGTRVAAATTAAKRPKT